MAERTPVQVGLIRTYVKDLSFESPRAPHVFRKQSQPEIQVKVDVNQRNVDGPVFEVSVHLTIEARSGAEVDFMVELEHSGLFEVQGAEGKELESILHVFCPTTIYPYARQVVDAALVQGSFPPLLMAPINFDALWRQRTGAPQGGGN